MNPVASLLVRAKARVAAESIPGYRAVELESGIHRHIGLAEEFLDRATTDDWVDYRTWEKGRHSPEAIAACFDRAIELAEQEPNRCE